jgi:hypothetical protein
MKHHVLLAGGSLLWLAACADSSAESRTTTAADAVPEQAVVAVDLSGSQTPARIAESRKALDEVIGNLGYGDRIVLIQVHQLEAQEEGARRWSETLPRPAADQPANSLDAERAERVRDAARAVATEFFEADGAGRIPTTDLFATLHIAAEYARAAPDRRTTLVLLSDMLQSAHGVEMSQAGGVPSAAWIEAQERAGVLPSLDGVCVVVIGADVTSAHGVAVRDFWRAYLAAAGAEMRQEDFRMITTGGAAGCSA